MSEFYTNVKVLGNNILYRGVQDGKKVQFKHEYTPKYYLPCNTPTEFKSLSGGYLKCVEQGSIKEARDFLKQYEDIDNFEVYGDIGFDSQFIAEHFKGIVDWAKESLNINIIDIENETENAGFPDPYVAEEKILLISVLNAITGNTIIYSMREYSGKPLDNCEIKLYSSEKDLLFDFVRHISESDIISGWNVQNYDIPFLINRTRKVCGDDVANMFSPWNKIYEKKSRDNYGKDVIDYDIYGIEVLDYLELYKKFTYNKQESYKLDFISNEELGLGKLDHSQYTTFKEFYTKDFDLFVEYNYYDTKRVLQLDQKLNLINLCVTMAYLAKINFSDVFSQIRMWDSIIYNHLLDINIIIPPKSKNSKSEQFEGAYVKEPIPGLYKWIVGFDATSLYPSIIQAWNISPETFQGMINNPITVDGLLNKEYNLSDISHCIAASGAMYCKDKKGLFPELVDIYMQKRKDAKNTMLKMQSELEVLKITNYDKNDKFLLEGKISRYDSEQMAFKIALNSLYGALGNVYFRYFKLENARAVTLTGQYIIKSVGNNINKDLNIMFSMDNYDWGYYNDTDSQSLTLEPIITKYYSNLPDSKIVDIIDKIAKEKLTPMINSYCNDLCTYTHTYRNTITFKREYICSSGVQIAKKRYFLNVLDNEGVRYNEPKMKIMGIEVVKSSTPKVIRDMLRAALPIILTGNERKLQDYILQVREEFKTYSIEQISFPRGVNGIKKYSNSTSLYSSGCPIHTKGAILFNHKIKELKLTNKYQLISDGDNVKFCYLKLPNPIKDKVMAFHTDLPKEFQLEQFIDYEMQFEKSFLAPLKSILDVINWNIEKKFSVSDFF